MRAKYVTIYAGALAQAPAFAVFSDFFVHADVMRDLSAGIPGARPRSAGFVDLNIQKAVCSGESESMMQTGYEKHARPMSGDEELLAGWARRAVPLPRTCEAAVVFALEPLIEKYGRAAVANQLAQLAKNLRSGG